jgi:hypothetical protein
MLPIEETNVKRLPKIDVPIYGVKIPSSGKEIKVRPFSVKEEKLLLMAAEANNLEDVITTSKQVLNNCIVSGDVDIDKLPFFDIDFLFIFLRAKSVGEAVEINLTCNNTLEDGNRCGHTFPTMMNISDCEIIKDESVTADIKLDKSSGVKMKYPNYTLVKKLDDVPEIDKKTIIIINSIEHIYDKNGIYSAKDYSSKELKDFVEGLTEEKYKRLEAFVDNFPTFVVKIEADCPKCGYHHTVRYSDFLDFFL